MGSGFRELVVAESVLNAPPHREKMEKGMNKENVLAVAECIGTATCDVNLGFNMGAFVAKWASGAFDKSGRECGTTACIAGWTRRVRTKKPVRAVPTGNFDWRKEGAWLGLSEAEAHDLFCAEDEAYGRLDDITPSQAVSCLRHLAETGKVDWERALSAPVS